MGTSVNFKDSELVAKRWAKALMELAQEDPGISKEDENLGVVYEEVDGGYVVDGDMFFEYYIVLTGKDPNAAHGTQFIVLTNDQHITYEQVSKSFLSSNSADSLSGTIVIGMKTID